MRIYAKPPTPAPAPVKCSRCQSSSNVLISKIVFANKSEHAIYWCYRCDRGAQGNGFYLPNHKFDMLKLPIARDYSLESEHCIVCGKQGAEYHHWAPRHLFEDAEQWPGDYLCPEHHKEWHAIVTPEMYKVKNGPA